jgi:acetylornithine deacetylase/succinyl-diaminopimelate desuccinylase-like protein
MQIFEKFKEQAQRVLQIPSNAESGNEELVRYLQSILSDFGFKTQIQEVRHSIDGLSRRQFNLLGFTSDPLVDRSTRRGVLFINPLDVVTASKLPAGQQVDFSKRLSGPGSVQGKIDFLCRIYGALDLLDHRHKNPVYLVGAAGSHYGMLGTRFLVESLAVNPKEVVTFAPTNLQKNLSSPGHLAIGLDVDLPARNRDSRGYNRGIQLIVRGKSVDFANVSEAANAMDLLLDLLLAAAQAGFDFQWSHLDTKGAEGCNPDFAEAKIFLTAFQFEDFKKFLQERNQSVAFEVAYLGVSDGGTSFLPTELIELILELDHEWRELLAGLNAFEDESFEYPKSTGSITRLTSKTSGKFHLSFEMRFLPQHQISEIQSLWKQKIKDVLAKHSLFHGITNQFVQVPGVKAEPTGQPAAQLPASNYLSDAGLFAKYKFPVQIMGVGSMIHQPKTLSEGIDWKDLEGAIETYREMMRLVSA